MMIISYDLFAEVNPAFGVFLISSFCRKFSDCSDKDPDIALLYLALPVSMSDDVAASFSATNSRTGLFTWLNRYPEIRLDLGDRLNVSLPIVTASIRLGISTYALEFGGNGTIRNGKLAPSKVHAERLPPGPKQVIRRAERLGTWMGSAGTTGSVFSAFGVTL